jgi:hypothetical protein
VASLAANFQKSFASFLQKRRPFFGHSIAAQPSPPQEVLLCRRGTNMAQARLVNDEFEIGFSPAFENRWHTAELAGRVVMILVVVAALLGFAGEGPFSHRTIAAPGHDFAVDFEPVARHSTATQVTFHLHPPPGAATVHLFLDSHFVEPMGLLRTDPRAMASQTSGSGLLLTYAVPPGAAGDQLVRLVAQPNQVGPIALSASVDGGPRLAWTQVILP